MTLRTDLVAFVQFLRALTFPQVTALCQFVGTSLIASLFASPEISSALQSVSDDILDNILSGTTGDDKSLEEFRPTLETYAKSLAVLPEVVAAFGPLFKMFGLVDLLRKVNVLQLMKLHEILQQAPGQELNVVQQLQQFFSSVDPATLQVVHGEIGRAQDPQQLLQNHLNLPMERFSLYRPIELLMSLAPEDFFPLQQAFPLLQPLQLYQLVELLRLAPFDVLEMRRTLVPEENIVPIDLDYMAPVVGLDQPWIQQQTSQVPSYPLRIKIVEQPPEQCIYRRNVKPNPVLMLVGDETLNDGNLFVTCTVVRCDEMTTEPKFLTGNAPIQVSSGRLVTFRKLKIMVTSHQQNETLYLLKFDLVRRTPHNPEGEVLHTTFSNPITVLSHSTQLRPAASTVPVIKEVIPISGPTSGGTRVAILGSNFGDGPGTRVRFDNIDVMPVYHGGGTLICHTPQHAPGIVQVTACNDPRRWSDTSASYTYESPSAALDQVRSSIGLSEKFGLGIAETVQEAAWEGGYDQMKIAVENTPNVNDLDAFGFAALHYVAARGRVEAGALLLNHGGSLGVVDRLGNTPLHWAVAHKQVAFVQFLLKNKAPVNKPNTAGATALHVAAVVDLEALTQVLLEHGANPNAIDFEGCTPLHWASVHSSSATVSQLLHHGAWIDPRDDQEETPLFWALREQNYDAAQLLVECGASVDAQNEDLETVLHLVSTMGDLKSAEQLLAAGAAAASCDANGATPSVDALRAGHREVVALFEKKMYKPAPMLFQTPASQWATRAFPIVV